MKERVQQLWHQCRGYWNRIVRDHKADAVLALWDAQYRTLEDDLQTEKTLRQEEFLKLEAAREELAKTWWALHDKEFRFQQYITLKRDQERRLTKQLHEVTKKCQEKEARFARYVRSTRNQIREAEKMVLAGIRRADSSK